MTDIVIRVENLSKQYRLGTIGTGTLSHDLNRWWAQVRGKPDPLLRVGEEGNGNRQGETIWALRDVSFAVKQGEVLGIIGRNGAGKSTLLKILSRVTAPTSGQIKIKGRIASLLEIGTGFHPELTGRENIYLNGTILGMRKAEVARKFDEIVAFAEIEKFIDTPVKRYSSGMYVRLAFAVAAHLEPEILLVDEVLAVGDAAFQKKCLGKMGDVAKEGRTVLFVSHNMAVVQSLCKSGILLQSGKIVGNDTIDQVVDQYLKIDGNTIASKASFPRPPNRPIWIVSASVLCNNSPTSTMNMGDTLSLEIDFSADVPVPTLMIGFVVSTMRGERVLNANNIYQPSAPLDKPVQNGTIRCELGEVPLMEANYFVSLWFGTNSYDYQYIENALSFEVVGRDIWGTGQSPTRHISLLWWPTEFKYLAA